MKKYILMIVSSMMLVSCVDTIILPDDKTVDEDFWKTKQQVASMVTAAYSSMASNDVMARLIVWGEFRTDEVLGPSQNVHNSTTKTALDEISAVNMQTTNMYAQWASIYTVINRCNIVLEKAQAVMNEDPNYTLGDYQVDRSQMLALRALCYFYLVRNFRDVPYIASAYMNNSQNMQVAQSAPAEVLQYCINDLEEASKTALDARGYSTSEWQRVGWLTADGINTLLADIYLWRASVMHSQADYAKCIEYCDKVIESKRNQHVKGYGETTEKAFPLAEASSMYEELFVEQNAEESIFELQSRSNTGISQYYYKYKSANNNGGEGWIRATNIFGNTSSTYNITTSMSSSTLYSAGDMRYYAACYIPSTSEVAYSIRKIVTNNTVSGKTTATSRDDLGNGGLDRNLNIYRLTDVMLMKAEALVQQVDTLMEKNTQDSLLHNAFYLVQSVNSRALHSDNQGDSIRWSSSTAASRFSTLSKDQFEQLVLQERMREFCFEGRRWYDLMRYNYRHISGVDYTRTLASINDAGEALPANSKDMLTLMTRKRDDASGVQAKMANEAYLYMPVPNSDIIVCPLLRQNPAYKDTKEFEKNY